jgi:hypothetical protein
MENRPTMPAMAMVNPIKHRNDLSERLSRFRKANFSMQAVFQSQTTSLTSDSTGILCRSFPAMNEFHSYSLNKRTDYKEL